MGIKMENKGMKLSSELRGWHEHSAVCHSCFLVNYAAQISLRKYDLSAAVQDAVEQQLLRLGIVNLIR